MLKRRDGRKKAKHVCESRPVICAATLWFVNLSINPLRKNCFNGTCNFGFVVRSKFLHVNIYILHYFSAINAKLLFVHCDNMSALANSEVKLNVSSSLNQLNQLKPVCVQITQNELPDSSITLHKQDTLTRSDDSINPLLHHKTSASLIKKVKGMILSQKLNAETLFLRLYEEPKWSLKNVQRSLKICFDNNVKSCVLR